MLKIADYKVKLIYDTYQKGNGLYVGLEDENGDFFSDITTNLIATGYIADEHCGYVKMGKDWGIDYVEWLEENGLAERTGRIGFSGFCTYAEMKFNH